MDIRPVKRRRRKPVDLTRPNAKQHRPGAVNPRTPQNNINIKSRLGKNLSTKRQNSRIKKVTGFIRRNYLTAGMLAFLSILYLPASKLINTSEQYQELASQSFSISAILNNASYLPQKLLLISAQTAGISGALFVKVLMFIFAVLVVYLFYKACLQWFGKNTALITTLLFSSSSWMILSSQSLVFNNIYLVFFPLVIYLHTQFSREKNSLKILAGVLLFSIVLYSPGMVWPILGIIALLPIFMHKIIAKYATEHVWFSLISTAVLVLPLFAVLVLRPNNFQHILVGGGQTTLQSFAHNLQVSLEALFIRGVPDIGVWLIGTPIFNFIACLLFVFGLIHLFINKKLGQHFNFMAISLAFSLLTIIFVGLPALPLLIPLIYLTAGFGLKLLLGSWYAIFPSNPVARNLGLTLVIFIALLSSGYDIARYYVAWPKNNSQISVHGPEKIT